MRLLLLALLCLPSFAQMSAGEVAGVEYVVTYLGIPCDAAAQNYGYPCPPEDRQGVMVQVRSADTGYYRISISYEQDGDEKSVAWRFTHAHGWITKAFQIGRVQTPTLHGIRILEVRIERESGAAIIITPSGTTLGPASPPAHQR